MESVQSTNKRKRVKRATRITLSLFLSLIIVVIVGLFITTSLTPTPLISLLQMKMVKGEVNSFKPKEEPATLHLPDGTVYIRNIEYGTKNPNSFLDIYLPDSKSKSNPTVLFVHGGGFAWGDKTVGNPLSEKENKESPHYLRTLAKKGFNVVSINYALTPETHYPEPVFQLDEAVQFLQSHGDKYGLSPTNLIFMGESAGGQLVGQYVNIQTNPQYATEMGLDPTLRNGQIKAVVFNSALLDANRFDKTDDALKNYLFSAFGRQYFDTDDLSKASSVDEGNVIRHLTAQFPPTYITDGNTGTFTEQAKDLDGRMESLGIPHKLNLYDRQAAKLSHGYESVLKTKYAKENFEEMVQFLNEYRPHDQS